ncbi:unnamed protein product [Acanthoscelides obtectus]|uniref:Uncharacterized protein n=1 Tax=Acanthoscelides obtectus TaxID=200917 RepID=A0A9P0LBI0_ACAOB|nr:unnamed protein product [Acanthoscelides obtectus]CAK1669114.1 hypothetical protein AOBTE_LOCUS26809 [Acanthoscelides obtectus]
MLYGSIWCNGLVIDTEATSTSESDNEPLSKYRVVSISSDDEPLSKYMAVRNQTHTPVDQDSNKRDSNVEQACEVISCQAEVLSSCFRCSTLLCIDHFQSEDISCISHKNRANEDNIVPVTSLNVDRYVEQSCEVTSCQAEVFSSCFRCSSLLFFDHFQSEGTPRLAAWVRVSCY